MTTQYIIYLITNTTNNKQYVGVTRTTLNRRWITHKSSARRGISHHKFPSALRKYDDAVWSKQELCCAIGPENASTLEKQFIASYNTYEKGYNSSRGGEVYDGYSKRERWTEARKLQMSATHSGKSYHSGKSGSSNPRYGKPGTMLGRRHNPSTQSKLKDAWASDPARKQQFAAQSSVPVTFNGIAYSSKGEAANKLGFYDVRHMNRYFTTVEGVLTWCRTPPKWWDSTPQRQT